MLFSIALLILRLTLGLSFMAHGAQKLFGWLGGKGFASTASNYETNLRMRPGWVFALLGGGGEFAGGALVVLGLLVPLGALLIGATMVVAIVTVTGKRGYFAGGGGWEYNALILIVCVFLILTGPGVYALDGPLGVNALLAHVLVGAPGY